MKKAKEPVVLREKKLSNGNISLYLDIYHQGKRQYEFLKIYVIEKPKSSIEREKNKENLLKAQKIRSSRQIELFNGQLGKKSYSSEENFLEYFSSITEERKRSKGNYDNWLSTYKHLQKFSKDQLSFKELDEKFLLKFKEYLLSTLSQNSAHSYFNKLKAALNQAFEEKVIEENPAKRIKGIKQAETKREFLSLEELQKLVQTHCEIPLIKTAFVFSALTGLRWSDIQKLNWSEIHYSQGLGWVIQFTQQKTKGVETLPISEQARGLLGEMKSASEKVFLGLKYSAWNNLQIAKWVMRADIKKDITFHCARHTFATLQLTNGTDIYTVSKLLGHRELKTTQVYAKVIDQRKIDAVNNFPKLVI
jgi:integrase